MNWEIIMHDTHNKGKDCFMICLLSIYIYIYIYIYIFSNVCYMNDKHISYCRSWSKMLECTNGYCVPFRNTGIQRNHLSGPSPDNKWPTREWSRIHFSSSGLCHAVLGLTELVVFWLEWVLIPCNGPGLRCKGKAGYCYRYQANCFDPH